MSERILILGTTGVNKSVAIEQLKNYAASQVERINFLAIDFEKEYLKVIIEENGLAWHSYLNERNRRQRELWLLAWKRCIYRLKRVKNDQNILLYLHGVFTRELIGTRSAVDIRSILEFGPTKIITLIDDVYLKRHRTLMRAAGASFRGEPTLEQLLDARRAEIFIGDLIAGHKAARTPHYVLAVSHPARTLYRLLFGNKIKTVYLSFPIARPCEMLEEGNNSGISEVNEFLKLANDFELKNPKIVCFCPLTIDEYPLVNTLSKYLKENPNIGRKEKKEVRLEFPFNKRWDVKSFWRDEILLKKDELPSKISIRLTEIEDAVGLIKSDVKLRDYRLVRHQAKCIAVFNPWFNGEETQGVRNEIRTALNNDLPVHIYQSHKHDPNGDAKKKLLPDDSGALGRDPDAYNVTFHDNISDLFSEVNRD